VNGQLALLDGPPSVVLWTDGSCKGDGWGGWGVIAIINGETVVRARGSEPGTTNGRMELLAAIEGLRLTQPGTSGTLFSDAQYVVRSAMEWIPGWRARGWHKSNGDPVANRDLIFRLDEELQTRRIRLEWVRGHDGNRFNEIADGLASEAAEARVLFREAWDHPVGELL